MTWEIVLGIIAIVGLVATCAGPMIKLSSVISRLTTSVDALNQTVRDIDGKVDALDKRVVRLEVKNEAK